MARESVSISPALSSTGIRRNSSAQYGLNLRWARISAILCLSSSNFFLNWAISETHKKRKATSHRGTADLPLPVELHFCTLEDVQFRQLQAHIAQNRSFCIRAKFRAEAPAALQCCSSLLGKEHTSSPFPWLPLCRLTKTSVAQKQWYHKWYHLPTLPKNIPTAFARPGSGKGSPGTG